MDEIQRRQCGNKHMHTEAGAKDVAKAMHKRHKARFAPYFCQWCEYWHVGTVRSIEAAHRRADRRNLT